MYRRLNEDRPDSELQAGADPGQDPQTEPETECSCSCKGEESDDGEVTPDADYSFNQAGNHFDIHGGDISES